jgi:hypothetical protein
LAVLVQQGAAPVIQTGVLRLLLDAVRELIIRCFIQHVVALFCIATSGKYANGK